MEIIIQLFKAKNEPLYIFGWICLFMALACGIMLFIPGEKIAGVHAYLKPFKFFVSTWIMAWSMMLYLPLLHEQEYVKWYVWLSIIALSFELIVITGQAMRGQLSHFNSSSAFNAAYRWYGRR
jgi:hypothetical protein